MERRLEARRGIWTSENAAPSDALHHTMSRARNITRRRSASSTRRVLSAMLISVTTGITALCAASAARAEQVESPTTLRDTAPPSAQVTMTAYRTLEQWVREWNVPEKTSMIDPDGTAGACVTLRLSGRVIGRASFMSQDKTAIWQAARRAWREAAGELGVEKDALRDEHTKEAAARVTIDLQLAGALTPITARSFAEAEDGLSPGIDGVAARAGEEIEGFFPGEMLSSNALPGRALQALSGRLGLPPLELGQLIDKNGLRAYRFSFIHLAQTQPGEAPVFLTRGGRVISPAELTGATIRSLATRIATHIENHKWPGDEPHGLMGTYLPLQESYDPRIAGAREQGIAAYALLRFARTPGIDAESRKKAIVEAHRIVSDLTQVSANEVDPLTSPVDAAAWLLAWSELTRLDPAVGHTEFAVKASSTIKAAWDDRDAWSVKTPAVGRAFIAFAMARSASLVPEQSWMKSAATDAVRGLFRQTATGELVALMPWLGWAELALAEGTDNVPATTVLREMRTTIWGHQVGSGELAPDLEGGIVFTKGPGQWPTWQGLRPLAFAATMLGDSRLTDDIEVPAELASLRRSLRFVMQLTIDETVSHMFRSPDRAIGGVRPAVWVQTSTLDASSLALLMVSETLRSVEARATPTAVKPGERLGRPTPAPPPR